MFPERSVRLIDGNEGGNPQFSTFLMWLHVIEKHSSILKGYLNVNQCILNTVDVVDERNVASWNYY